MSSNDHKETKKRLNECSLHQFAVFHSTLSEMKKAKIDTDMTIVCGKKEFHVHQIVMKGASTYFRNMLDSDFVEKKTKRVDLSVIDENVIDYVIDFMYFATPPNMDQLPFDVASELFKAAHLFDLPALFDYVWDEMDRTKNLQNCIEILRMSNFYNIVNNDKIANYVIDHLSDFVGKEEFLNIDEEPLLLLLRKAKENEFTDTGFLVKMILDWVRKDKNERIQKLVKLLSHVDLHSVSKDYLKQLLEEEPLFFEQNDVMKLLVTVSLETKTPNRIKHSKKKFYFFGYHCEISENTYLKKSAMQIFNGQKERVVDLPFLLIDGMSCKRWKNFFYFIGGIKNGRPCKTFIQYDPEQNNVSYLPDLEFAVSNANVCIANADTLYVITSSIVQRFDTTRSLQVQYYKNCTWKTVIIREKHESILSVANLDDMVYILCLTEASNDCKVYRLFYLTKENECKNYYIVPSSFDLHTNLITQVGNSLCCFVFDDTGTSICHVFTLANRWTSIALPFRYKRADLSNIKLIPCRVTQDVYFVKNSYDFSLVSFNGKNVSETEKTSIDVDLGAWKTEETRSENGIVEHTQKFVKKYEILAI